LRDQFRNESSIAAYTSEGVEIETNVFAVSSISKEPEIITLAYVGSTQVDDIKGLKTFEDKEKGVVIVEDIFDIDSDDASEVYKALGSNQDLVSEKTKRNSSFLFPYYEDRIRNIAHSKLGGNQKEDAQDWADLPVKIAVGVFRRMLSAESFDGLYLFDNLDEFPLEDQFRHVFIRSVKNQGLLSYQFIKLPDGKAFSGFVGEEIEASLIEKLPIRDFQGKGSSKVLRNHGITILSAGFSDIVPNENIRAKIMKRWQVRWERDIKVVKAKHELEAMRILNATRAQMQREMTYLLSNIFQSDPHSEEALALRTFQALEVAAADPADDISAKEIFLTLQNLHRWLLSEKQNGSPSYSIEKTDDDDSSIDNPLG